ncbi:hypothetical protein SAMN04487996_111264 [Dyadobacter soli]|uniref:Uncharacterized protein n=1 Tax=Dyadobacter soli TaxID=659014 RepID=A0A1G7MH43_9BACT|nr:hypothetical protein [Dyadobacter soli]SDF60956.1 hypothetical protein SAMN04487996_111264 [Dyadobacter soli]
MFYRFKPRKSPATSDQQTERLNAKIRDMQRKWAQSLQQGAEKLPKHRLKTILILAGILASAAASFLLYDGLASQPPTIHRFNLSIPTLAEPILVPKGPERQQALDDYLDSLEKALILDSLRNIKIKK